MDTTPDRIERSIHLAAPRERVWRALADAGEFGRWFGVDFGDAQFAEGEATRGRITHPGYDHLAFRIQVERMEPGRRFSFLWHPYAIDPAVDYDVETPTRVEFLLEDEGDGTRLTVVESGFDKVPAHRRAEAFRMNGQGWTAQMDNIARHVA